MEKKMKLWILIFVFVIIMIVYLLIGEFLSLFQNLIIKHKTQSVLWKIGFRNAKSLKDYFNAVEIRSQIGKMTKTYSLIYILAPSFPYHKTPDLFLRRFYLKR